MSSFLGAKGVMSDGLIGSGSSGFLSLFSFFFTSLDLSFSFNAITAGDAAKFVIISNKFSLDISPTDNCFKRTSACCGPTMPTSNGPRTAGVAVRIIC